MTWWQDARKKRIRGCSISLELLNAWSERFVYKRAPFYLQTENLTLLPAAIPVVSRVELASDWADLPLDARDGYTTYNVAASAEWVSILDSASLLALEPQTRAELLHLQWTLGRGQIYTLRFYEEVSHHDPAAGLAEPFVFEAENELMLSLQYEVWQRLSLETRSRWLKWFVSQDDTACHSSTLSEDMWNMIDADCGPMPRRLAGTFSPRSGPNCFSTALAGAIPDVAFGVCVADLWLHQEAFLRGLTRLGFRPCAQSSNVDQVTARSVVVWSTPDGQAQHACFVPLDGWALNKDAQGWHAPRQLLPLVDLTASWRDAGLQMQVYRAE
jgi:hypothetical protein